MSLIQGTKREENFLNYIKSLHLEGFKKFISLDVNFNAHMNILVGENEAGKSTILDAIKIVLNQQYRNADKSVLRDLFNTKMIEDFQTNPSIKTLPRILIEIELCLDPKQKNSDYFYGEVYGARKNQNEKYGIRFECRYDEELGAGLEQSIIEGKIPYEYYSLTWMTFKNRPYQIIKKPLHFLSIDTTNSAVTSSFNYYNRTLFTSKYNESIRAKVKNEFRSKLEDAFESAGLPPIGDNRKFGVDSKKVVLETILSVYENSISLENRGSGMESLIKTQIALDKANGLDVILIEEPENHLDFSTLRKMLQEISDKQNESQIIVTTHNNMIASRLNLKNVLWITENRVQSLSKVDEKVLEAQYGPYLGSLVVELTEEEERVESYTRKKISFLKRHGGQVALDDFGAGYNGEVSLLAVRPDFIKVDLSIVRNCHQDKNRQEMISNIISFARKNNSLVIAEGVQSREEMDTVISLGVDYLQGYYVGVPSLTSQPIPDKILKEITSRSR